MTLQLATEDEPAGERVVAPDAKKGPAGVVHALDEDADAALCGRPASRLAKQPGQPWPGGLGAHALCPGCETAVRQGATG